MDRPLILSVSVLSLHLIASVAATVTTTDEASPSKLRRRASVEEALSQRRTQEATEGDDGFAYSYDGGLPGILWVFISLAAVVACLLVFGRRKMPDFSKETENLIVVPRPSQVALDKAAEAMVDESQKSHGEEEPLAELKEDYQATGRTSNRGPSLMRKATNPAGLVARPQYNDTGIFNGLLGGRRKGKSPEKASG